MIYSTPHAPNTNNIPYGVIGNCRVLAMVSDKASIDWACFPRFDSPSAFAKLLDTQKGGAFSIQPVASEYENKQEYIRNTNISRTVFTIPGEGAFEVIDFAPRFQLHERYFMPSAIYRIVRPIEGAPKIVVDCDPQLDYAREETEVKLGSNHISYSKDLRLTCNAPLNYVLEKRAMRLEKTLYMVLTWGAPFEDNLEFKVEEFYERTKKYWETWVKRSNIPNIYQDEVIRASLTLKLHYFADTGAIIAATTTSLPEHEGSVRNWDYRYCWIRDAYFVIKALDTIGHYTEKEKYMSFLSNLIDRDAGQGSEDFLQPLFGIAGEKVITEHELDHLDGFQGAKPVRIGNAAYTHKQFDVYGEIVLAMAPIFFDRRLISYDLERLFEDLKYLVEKAISLFNKPDASIWEFRSDESVHTFSQIFIWAAVDRGAKVARHMQHHGLADSWEKQADEMQKIILEEAWSEQEQMFTQRYGGHSADASNLLMAELGIIKARDPRFISTVKRYGEILRKDDYMYRYVTQDDFGLPKTSFTICTFWYISALIKTGEVSEAKRLYDNILDHRNHLGLLSEDIDAETGKLWGNFPQTYSMVGIIAVAKELEEALGLDKELF